MLVNTDGGRRVLFVLMNTKPTSPLVHFLAEGAGKRKPPPPERGGGRSIHPGSRHCNRKYSGFLNRLIRIASCLIPAFSMSTSACCSADDGARLRYLW